MLALCAALAAAVPAAAAETDFATWLDGLRAEATAKGIAAPVVSAALDGVEPVPRVLELDRFQPEFTQTFWAYLGKRVTDTRIERGREMLKKHAALLARVEKKFGVQPRFLVAFWGLESNFGDHTGIFPLFGALATLAHDARRADFFRAQLLAALRIMEKGDIDAGTKASWAGAMGQCQFIPTTHLDNAVDFDGDGKRDFWNSLPDIFASAANYLGKTGWQGDRTWGREVRLPKGFDLELAGLGTKKKLAEWQKLGVRKMGGGDLPAVDVAGSVILPAGRDGPAFMVYKNFHSILAWNRSILYAVAVGHLADRLAGQGPFRTPRPAKEVALSRADVMEMQRLLTRLGHDTGGSDGVAGRNTRDAIKAFQRTNHLPPDGYPSFGLLERLRGAAAKAGG
ncbi:MAG: lytic murein transglycosylase [Hyphomicrobiales bacterium]|nr:lytic murein transglycosylase [Hyphomicrobiales bacterium]